MRIAEFLLARIAEDEATARLTPRQFWDEIAFNDQAADDIPHIVRHSPKRVLAECEAKRQIVAEHSDWYSPDDPTTCEAHDGKYAVDECPTLRALAAVYADHSDYRNEWKP